MTVSPPLGMLVELTHRCPLQCGYCSNPLNLLKADREFGTQDWLNAFAQAEELGVRQAHLSGGKPTLRRDLEGLIADLSKSGVYTNLITTDVTLTRDRLFAFRDADLRHI
ncbi:radical SAM protein [Breoghania sp.]|uniref:radical SAM protein n=1 Tax=Breoghania sp. TaxID=2065378 RepID=UPI00260957F6|nr:radical SAM protein [Breoghania sp.]MDJ0930437.1 radical SAM protein [Breoghania sp.]